MRDFVCVAFAYLLLVLAAALAVFVVTGLLGESIKDSVTVTVSYNGGK